MTTYNFFSEIITPDETVRILEIKRAFKKIKKLEPILVKLINKNGYYSIIGQFIGEDTNLGDIDLIISFGNIKYTFFDAFCPQINNIKL